MDQMLSVLPPRHISKSFYIEYGYQTRYRIIVFKKDYNAINVQKVDSRINTETQNSKGSRKQKQ
jgi:hypothetical protein